MQQDIYHQKDDSLSSLVQLCFSTQLLEVCAFHKPGLVVPYSDRSVSNLLFWCYVFGFHLQRQRICKYERFLKFRPEAELVCSELGMHLAPG